MNQFHPFEEENETIYEYKKPVGRGEKYPQKGRSGDISETRRSPGGLSPARIEDITPRDPQLIPFAEFQDHITKMKSNLLKIGISEIKIDEKIQSMKDQQNELYLQLSPQQRQEYKRAI